MSSIQRSALVSYSQIKMFDLVYDVPAYHEFLPWCDGARILKIHDYWVEAEIDIDYKGFVKSFSTRNSITKFSAIKMELINGPFEYLEGNWEFGKLDENSSRVSLDLRFEFSGFVLRKLLTPIFEHIGNTMVDSFVARAKQVYG